jgi:hypothetical protein
MPVSTRKVQRRRGGVPRRSLWRALFVGLVALVLTTFGSASLAPTILAAAQSSNLAPMEEQLDEVEVPGRVEVARRSPSIRPTPRRAPRLVERRPSTMILPPPAANQQARSQQKTLLRLHV